MMAKLILEFDAVEEQEAASQAVNGPNYYDALCQIENKIKQNLKYSELTDEQFQFMEDFQTFFYEVTAGLLHDR